MTDKHVPGQSTRGWPTEAMIEAGRVAHRDWYHAKDAKADLFATIYLAMEAARPKHNECTIAGLEHLARMAEWRLARMSEAGMTEEQMQAELGPLPSWLK